MLATEPATADQRGAVMGEFERLGIVDRGERLALAAELLGLDALGSTKELMMGDAGRLVGLLRRTRDRGELSGITARVDDDEDQAYADTAPERSGGWAELLARLVQAIYRRTS